MASKSDEELMNILESKDSFDDQAILAATWELDKRNLSNDSSSQLQETITTKIEVQESKQKNSPTIPKVAIYLTSFLLTPLFGSILLIVNIVELKKWNALWIIVPFAIIYTVLSLIVYNLFSYHFGVIIIANALGGVIISEVLWNKYIEK